MCKMWLLNLSLCFNGHFPGEPGLVGVYWSKGWWPWWCGDIWTTIAISRAKLRWNHHHLQTNTQFFTGRMPFLSPNQQCQSTEGKNIISWTWLPQAHLGVFELCLWPLIAPGYLGEGCHASHQPSVIRCWNDWSKSSFWSTLRTMICFPIFSWCTECTIRRRPPFLRFCLIYCRHWILET